MILTVSARDNRQRRKTQTIAFNEERYKDVGDISSYYYKVNNEGAIRMDKSGKYDDNDLVRLFARL